MQAGIAYQAMRVTIIRSEGSYHPEKDIPIVACRSSLLKHDLAV